MNNDLVIVSKSEIEALIPTSHSHLAESLRELLNKAQVVDGEATELIKITLPIFHYLAWIAICWNDHNFDDKAVYEKVNKAFTEAGFNRKDGVSQVNNFVARVEKYIEAAKKEG